MWFGFAAPAPRGEETAGAGASAVRERRAAEAPRLAMRCGRCRHEYAPEAWDRLEVVDRIFDVRTRGLVTAWPEDVAVEIRRCFSCGGAIARKRPRLR